VSFSPSSFLIIFVFYFVFVFVFVLVFLFFFWFASEKMPLFFGGGDSHGFLKKFTIITIIQQVWKLTPNKKGQPTDPAQTLSRGRFPPCAVNSRCNFNFSSTKTDFARS